MKEILGKNGSLCFVFRKFLINKRPCIELLYNNYAKQEKMVSLQERLQYKFNNIEFLFKAMTHSSFVHEFNYYALDSYEKLEFLGDSLLNSIVSIELFGRYPGLSEGELSKFRGSLVNTYKLSELATFLDFPKMILLGKGEVISKIMYQEGILADTFEALIGAIYLDLNKNFSKLQKIFLRLIKSGEEKKSFTFFDLELLSKFDPKSRLQEIMMIHYRSMPQYSLQDKTRDVPPFKMSLLLHGKKVATVIDNSKKKGEKKLAAMALEKRLYLK